MASTTTIPEQLLAKPAASQLASPLFGLVPAEIRSQIFSLALADHPDPDPESRYEPDSPYVRPAYFAPRRTDVRLLRTCRAVYRETWFLPFVLREQTYWLTFEDRAPPGYGLRGSGFDTSQLRDLLGRIGRQLGGGGGDNDDTGNQAAAKVAPVVEIESLRVFAQMWALESGHLGHILADVPRLAPRRLVLTIRHTDWWFWEDDKPLQIEGGGWIKNLSRARVLPASVREVRVELESLERKRDQVDAVARGMCRRWRFGRADGTVLYPDASGASNDVDRWSGSSTWNGKTWTRDETRPGQVDYYVVGVPFRPKYIVEGRGGTVSDWALSCAARDVYPRDAMRLPAAGDFGDEGSQIDPEHSDQYHYGAEEQYGESEQETDEEEEEEEEEEEFDGDNNEAFEEEAEEEDDPTSDE